MKWKKNSRGTHEEAGESICWRHCLLIEENRENNKKNLKNMIQRGHNIFTFSCHVNFFYFS